MSLSSRSRTLLRSRPVWRTVNTARRYLQGSLSFRNSARYRIQGMLRCLGALQKGAGACRGCTMRPARGCFHYFPVKASLHAGAVASAQRGRKQMISARSPADCQKSGCNSLTGTLASRVLSAFSIWPQRAFESLLLCRHPKPH